MTKNWAGSNSTSQGCYAWSFYVTKTVLVGPKWFWSDQIDLDLTIMIWSRPKWNGHDQNEMVMTKMNWSGPNCDFRPLSLPFHFGRDQIIMVKSKSIWSDQNHFGPTKTVLVNLIIQKLKSKHLVCLSFLWWQGFWGNERKYFTHIPGLSLQKSCFETQIFLNFGLQSKRNF